MLGSLKRKRIVHRTIDSHHVYIAEDMDIKLAHFQNAKKLEDDSKRLHSARGRLDYQMPEVIMQSDKGYQYELDLWQLGVLVYEMLIGHLPFQGDTVKRLSKQIIDPKLEVTFPKEIIISPQAKDFCTKLLVKDFRRRISV